METWMMVFTSVSGGVLAILLIWFFMLMPRWKTPELIKKLSEYRFAHRGLHDGKSAPENSLAAFRKAAEAGYAAELDVHISKDGRLVVMHDENVLRMCGRDALICDMTSEEIDSLRLLDSGEKIPYLEDVLPIFEKAAPLLIEVKTRLKGFSETCSRLFAQLDNYKGLYCVESFDPRVLLWLRFKRPHVVRGQLSGFINKHGDKLFFLADFFLSNLLINFISRPDFVAYRFDDRKGTAFRLFRKLFKTCVFFWTIDSPKKQRAAEEEGGVIIFERFLPDSNDAGERPA